MRSWKALPDTPAHRVRGQAAWTRAAKADRVLRRSRRSRACSRTVRRGGAAPSRPPSSRGEGPAGTSTGPTSSNCWATTSISANDSRCRISAFTRTATSGFTRDVREAKRCFMNAATAGPYPDNVYMAIGTS